MLHEHNCSWYCFRDICFTVPLKPMHQSHPVLQLRYNRVSVVIPASQIRYVLTINIIFITAVTVKGCVNYSNEVFYVLGANLM